MSELCANDVIEACPLFQVECGGATPTLALHFRWRIIECSFEAIRPIFEAFHYKGGHIGGGITACLALAEPLKFIAGAVIGPPRHPGAYAHLGNLVVEIRRMDCLQAAPKNTESYFLGKICWWIQRNTAADAILSYSDQTVGHKGTIYRAANFDLIGETEPTMHVFWNGVRYHPRSLSIERPYSYQLRAAMETGEATMERGKPKLVFARKLNR